MPTTKVNDPPNVTLAGRVEESHLRPDGVRVITKFVVTGVSVDDPTALLPVTDAEVIDP